jgi:predicted nucleic acid-binding protein
MTQATPRPSFVLDTSVALKWFVASGEADVGLARRLRQAYLDGECTLAAPDLLLVEVANALAVGHRRKIGDVLTALEALLSLDLRLYRLRPDTLHEATRLAAAHPGITVYDACFWALAVKTGGALVTADEKFLRILGPHPNVIPLRHLELPESS